MAHRTQYHQIFQAIISSASINMMDSEYLWNFVISTTEALTHKPFSNHFLSDGGKLRAPFIASVFPYTLFRTVFSTFRKRIPKFLFAIFTLVDGLTPSFLRYVVTFSRTIFRCVATTRDMRKHDTTNFTRFCHLNSGCQTQTFSRAVFKRCCSIFRNVNLFFAMQTINIRDFHYASR